MFYRFKLSVIRKKWIELKPNPKVDFYKNRNKFVFDFLAYYFFNKFHSNFSLVCDTIFF